ncbi:hypothetical protein O3P69_003030 [Scylla paramamosain]|uniref:DUF7869 domain-containing protein n=1 Tax=Scylla paramamosain TaxID=85552 RepID=A0AAW0UN52_SCYPA
MGTALPRRLGKIGPMRTRHSSRYPSLPSPGKPVFILPRHCTPRADRRGKHVPKHAMPLSRKNLVECHIKSFPTVSSHYTRAKSPLMRYLDTEMTMKKITDTCSKCDRYEVSKKDANTEEEAQGIQAQWDEHLSFAKEGMKAMADMQKDNDPDTRCICLDLQQTLPVPRLCTNIAYYKRKLWVYNLCIHNLKTKKNTFYVWDEMNAGRGSVEVATCIARWIEDEQKEGSFTTLKIVSDNCGGQNKNINIILFYLRLIHSTTLQNITHTYLIPGHSYMACDRAFGHIEKYIRRVVNIYDLKGYVRAIKLCTTSRYHVIVLRNTDFLDFEVLQKSITHRKPKPPLQFPGCPYNYPQKYPTIRRLQPGKLQHLQQLLEFIPNVNQPYLQFIIRKQQELDNTEEDDSTEDEDEDHLEYDSDSEDIVDDPQPLQDEDNTVAQSRYVSMKTVSNSSLSLEPDIVANMGSASSAGKVTRLSFGYVVQEIVINERACWSRGSMDHSGRRRVGETNQSVRLVRCNTSLLPARFNDRWEHGHWLCLLVMVVGVLAAAGLAAVRFESEDPAWEWEPRKTRGSYQFQAQNIPHLDKKHVRYDFAYSVRDDDTGAAYSHKEERSGDTTQGEYRVSLPDGRIQVVSYVADENGYRAKVSYEPAAPPVEVNSALKYAPKAGKYRPRGRSRHRGRQRRPRVHKRPRTRPNDPRYHSSQHSYLPEPPSSYIPAPKDTYLPQPPSSYIPASEEDSYLPEPPSSYLPASEENNSYLPEPQSSYLPASEEDSSHLPETPSSSYLPVSEEEEDSYLPVPPSSSYLPVSEEEEEDYLPEPPSSYLPKPPLSSYLPVSEENSYLPKPPSSSYLPTSGEDSYLPETPSSSYLPASGEEEEEEDSYLPKPPPSSYLPVSEEEEEEEDSYLPEAPSSYLPKPPSSSYLPASEEEDSYLPEHLSYLPKPTKEPPPKHSVPHPSEPDDTYVPPSSTPTSYLPPKEASSYDPYSISLPSFPPPPHVVPSGRPHQSSQPHYGYSSTPHPDKVLEVTTYRPQRPSLTTTSTYSDNNSVFPGPTTATPSSTHHPLKLPEVTSYKPNRPSSPPVSTFFPTPAEEEPLSTYEPSSTVSPTTPSPQPTTYKPSTTASSDTHSTTRPTTRPFPLSYSLAPKPSHPHPPTAPSYPLSLPVPYTPAPSYGEPSPQPYRPPLPPLFWATVRSTLPWPTVSSSYHRDST